MTLYLGSDHGGFVAKESLKMWLEQQGYQVTDCGAYQLDRSDDYPDFAFKVAQSVAQDQTAYGILICRSGGGMAITANRISGIRAIEGYSENSVQHGRQDNNANVLTLAGDWLSLDQMQQMITLFIKTPFSEEERHQRRIQKIESYTL